MSVRPEVGQFIVVFDWGLYITLGPVSKVTPQQVQHPHKWGRASTSRTPIDRVIFAGSKNDALALKERLNSSADLCDQEQNAAARRHEDRLRKLVAAANEGRER